MIVSNISSPTYSQAAPIVQKPELSQAELEAAAVEIPESLQNSINQTNQEIGNADLLLTQLQSPSLSIADRQNLIDQLDASVANLNDLNLQIENDMQQNSSPEEFQNFMSLKNDYADHINEYSSLSLKSDGQSANQLLETVTNNLLQSQDHSMISSASQAISQMGQSGASYFAIMYAVMIFCYNSSSEAGKLQLMKQKDAQDAASQVTDINRFMRDIKQLINDDSMQNKGSDDKTKPTSIEDLFKRAFADPVAAGDEKLHDTLIRYKDMLNRQQGPALDADGNVKLDDKGNPIYQPYLKSLQEIDWGGKGGNMMFEKMLDGSIDDLNLLLKNNGVSPGGMIAHFDDYAYTAYNSNDDTKNHIKSFFETQEKTCESTSAQLTTINQTLQATVSQATETVKSLIESLKQTIQNYGVTVSPR